ncbi:glycosyltransferase [Photobacterium phosphoreum]|uniref:glycosyltransferase n=1 Tax=Photobacterium phosphoreum TaxID=659 RepID=UPI000D15FD24|nr:hypothetical protein CTM75_19690 [Photobacterium phosphoreum]
MKVSIITVCYNSAKTIRDTFDSIKNQTYKNIEYIVIDGGSTDNTKEIANQYKDNITTFISGSDKGLYDAMNKGIALASGDIVGTLNSDDICLLYTSDAADDKARVDFGGRRSISEKNETI